MKKLDELDKKDTWCRGILGHSFCRSIYNKSDLVDLWECESCKD
jgi:hypothetical protein